MSDPLAVGAVERVRDLNRAADRLVERERALLQSLRNRLTLQILHYEVVRSVLVANVKQRANMRMAERRDRTRFAFEPITKLRISREGFRQDLDRDGAIESLVSRARYTSPMPPTPILAAISYGPRRVPAVIDIA